MVDKSDWPISNRAKTGSKTKGSSVEVLTIGDAFDSPDAMRDGVNIRNYNDITKRIYTMRGDGQEELTVNITHLKELIRMIQEGELQGNFFKQLTLDSKLGQQLQEVLTGFCFHPRLQMLM
jgi:hypothetical protein